MYRPGLLDLLGLLGLASCDNDDDGDDNTWYLLIITLGDENG